jgi:DNA-binding GntR family transcriptional regulator
MDDGGSATTTTARVTAELRHAILEGVLAPGERLRAEALAERFGTSRTPIREALGSLEVEGLIELQPRRGAVVRPFDSADLLDLYEVRALIEPFAAARAATRLDQSELDRLNEICALAEARSGDRKAAVDDQISWNEEFHRVIVEGADSPRLQAAMRGVAGIPRAFRAAFWANEAERTKSLFYHREIVRALESQRPEAAEAIMRVHILNAREFLAEVMHGDDEA